MKNKKTLIGIILFVILIGIIILIKYLKDEKGLTLNKNLTTIYIMFIVRTRKMKNFFVFFI